MNKKYLKFPVTSIGQAFKFMPEDFKDCFWNDFELKMKDFFKYALETCLDYEAEEV